MFVAVGYVRCGVRVVLVVERDERSNVLENVEHAGCICAVDGGTTPIACIPYNVDHVKCGSRH